MVITHNNANLKQVCVIILGDRHIIILGDRRILILAAKCQAHVSVVPVSKEGDLQKYTIYTE